MKTSWKNSALALLAVGLIVCLAALAYRGPAAYGGAQGAQAAGSGVRYSVIDTEGHNLIVVDNQTNTLFFYTIDKDKEVGSELKLRGSIDLTQVGKPVIKPVKANQD